MKTPALACVILCATAATTAQADYIITPLFEGLNDLELVEGESATIDFVVTSDANDQLDSAIFSLVLTEPGIQIDGYTWAAPFATGGIFDDSTLPPEDLPVAIDGDTHTAPGAPFGLIDFEFSNVLIGQSFTTGTILSVDISVPVGLGYEGNVFIIARPDTFADGFNEIDTEGGTALTLSVLIPAPGGVVCAIGAVPLVLRRRRG